MAITAKEAAQFKREGHRLTNCEDCGGAGKFHAADPESMARATLCEACAGEGVLFGCAVPGCEEVVQRYDLNPFESLEKVGGICDACAAEARLLGMTRDEYAEWIRLQGRAA